MALPHAVSGQIVNVGALGHTLQDAQTQALIKASQLEVARLVLPAGRGLPEHQVRGEITLQCIEGRVEFSAHGATQVLVAGDWLHLAAGAPHGLRALSDASLLLTICLAAPD